jgi:hypothetical protein
VAWAIYEVGSSAYDVFDLARTSVAFASGRASKGELAVTAAGVGVGVFAFGGGYGRAAREGIEAAGRAGARNVAEQLAFQELAPRVARDAGVVLAGGSSKSAFRAAAGYAERFGGEAADWVKKSTTSSHAGSGGSVYQLHWVQNQRTGQIVDVKLKSYAKQ